MITSVSIGYKNKDYVEIEGGARITQWTPFEVSLVSVPADPHATIGIRSMSNEFTRREAGEIMNLAHRHNLVPDALSAIESGMSIDDFRSHVLDKIGSKGALDTGPVIGLTDNEAKAFSLSRAIWLRLTMIGVMRALRKRCCGLPLGIQHARTALYCLQR